MLLNKKDGGTRFVEGASSIAFIGLLYAFAGPTAVLVMSESTFGNTLGDTLSEMKESSFNSKLNELYEEGKITESQYKLMLMIKNMSEEEWQDLESQLDDEVKRLQEKGNLTDEEREFIEQCNWIKSVRNMSTEEWKNEDNLLNAIAYSFSIAAWEGMQWYVGGHLSSWIASRVGRVGVDTGFNALDTFYRASMRSTFLGEDFEEAWVKEGGWESTLINTAIGLAGSTVGEVIDYNRYKDCECRSLKEFNDKVSDLSKQLDEGIISAADVDNFLSKNIQYVYDNIGSQELQDLGKKQVEYRVNKNKERMDNYYKAGFDCADEYLTESRIS